MFEGLTNKGKEYMAKCLAENKPISFAKVKIGDGTIGPGENPETFIDIKSIKKEVSIVDKTQIGDTVKLTVQLDNTGVLEGYFPREIGIYVQDGGQELLYWYINDGFESSWLPPASKSPVKFKYHINLMVTNLETVIVNWSGKELWVDREYLGKELDKKLNNGNLPTPINNAEMIFKVLQANTGIKFDSNLLYLNDAGTKKKGFCYLDKLTDGIFECIQLTTTTINNAIYFKNFSNKENNDLLCNLKFFENDIFNLTQIGFQERCTSFKAIDNIKIPLVSNWERFNQEIYTVNNTRYYRPGLEFDYKITIEGTTSYRIEIKNIKFKFKEKWSEFFETTAMIEPMLHLSLTPSQKFFMPLSSDGSVNQTINVVYDKSWGTTEDQAISIFFKLEVKLKDFLISDFPTQEEQINNN